MPARFLVIEIRKRNSKQCFQRRGSQGVITCRRGHGVKSVEVMEKEDFTVKEDFTRYVLSSDHASFYSVFLHLIMQTLAAYLEHVRCLLPLASLRFEGFLYDLLFYLLRDFFHRPRQGKPRALFRIIEQI